MFVHSTFRGIISPRVVAIGIIATGMLIAVPDTAVAPFGKLLAIAGFLCIALRMV